MNETPSQPSGFDADRDRQSIPLEGLTRIVNKDGRWVVWLNVQFWEASAEDGNPIENHWTIISDYSTEGEAIVAARWIERSVNKQYRPPTGF
ncbi:MAG: hypothetical protein R3C03_21840 [Pirellulaceae bacterium]